MSVPGAILVTEKTIELVSNYFSIETLHHGPLITLISPPLKTYYLIPPNSNVEIPLVE